MNTTNKAICLVMTVLAAGAARADVAELVRSAGVKSGLIVHLGCGDGRETAKLAGDRYLVHGLDADEANVRAARENIRGLALYGRVSVWQFDRAHLPYADNLVNLLIAPGGEAAVPAEEVLRALVPGGAALIGGKKIVKSRPAEIDEWTHFLHGPDNNAVAQDSRVGVPRSIQWVSGPRWGRSHEELASMSAAVTAKGRIYYIVDEAPLASIRFTGDWKLVARDAFNGVLLWKRRVSPWNDHLRHFRSGPVHLPRRLVAVGQEVYVTPGLGEPVVKLDGATGETLLEYKGSDGTEEIVADGGHLYLAVGTSEANRRGGGLHGRGEPAPTDFRFVTAIRAQDGKALWRRDIGPDEALLPLTLAVKGSRLYYQASAGVVCLDSGSGKELWKAPRRTPARRMGWSAPTLVATEEAVLLADREAGKSEQDSPAGGAIEWGVHGWGERGFARKAKCTLRAYAAKDGAELWSADCAEGYNSPVDVFVIGDVVWVGPSFRGLDLKTGSPAGQLNTAAPAVGMPHHRCYRDKATTRYILTGKSGIEVLSLDKGWLSNNSWVRGTCQYGIIPANGLIYAPPDACACYLTVKSPGFFAAAPQRGATGRMPFPDKHVLAKGPLYGKPLEPGAARADDWPTYRHDAARSQAASCTVPDALGPKWTATVGGRLTQPVIAAGKVYVASIDAHTLHALADDDGREVWRFTAGGRIDSAPTAHKGTVLFGCADGWVYCLGAADGQLVWRFRAAPRDRLIAAYGQLESVWPVHGAVLVQNGAVYLTAGRSSFLDGGIVLYRLDPATGEELSRTVLYHLDPVTGRQLVPEARFNMEGTTSDILSGDGELVYLKYFGFDRDGKRAEADRPHLFSIAGLLGEEWFVRSYWIVGAGMPGAGWAGWANAARAFPSGRILCFNDEAVYGYGRQTVAGGATGHKADAYHLFRMGRQADTTAPAGDEAPKPNLRRRPRKMPARVKRNLTWADTRSLIVRAMVLAGDKLAVAGPADLGRKSEGLLAFENEAEALAGFRGREGVYLRVVAAADGSKVSECRLEGMPVFDGMAAAGGKVYLSLASGSVVCLGR